MAYNLLKISENIDCLYGYYRAQLFDTVLCVDPAEDFKLFYKKSDLSIIDNWLGHKLECKSAKNNDESASLRRIANGFYLEKDYRQSVKAYTESLMWAVHNSVEYGVALAGRSLVLFLLDELHACMRDIDLCMETDYPFNMKVVALRRKANCLSRLGYKEELDECYDFIINLLHINAYCKCKQSRSEKLICKCIEEIIEELDQLRENVRSDRVKLLEGESLPEVEGGPNPSFAFASSKVKLSHSALMGREVIAADDINEGDILFVEKAFCFAPYFNTEGAWFDKCYNCIVDLRNTGIPCKTCCRIMYCSSKCRDDSWTTGLHQFECLGMQADGNLWAFMGFSYPVLKAIFRATQDSNFVEILTTRRHSVNYDPQLDIVKFGDKINNYKYFNRQILHMHERNNCEMFVLLAAAVMRYLTQYTNFISYVENLLGDMKSIKLTVPEMLGCLFVRHANQMNCSVSAIHDWRLGESEPEQIRIAYAIYPSVELLNHCCKPNISVQFKKDVAIVRAVTDIPKGNQVFNCYGASYVRYNKQERSEMLKSSFFFVCFCKICKDPCGDLEFQNCFKCPRCGGRLPSLNEKSDLSLSLIRECLDCKRHIHLRNLLKVEAAMLENIQLFCIDELMSRLEILDKYFYANHRYFQDAYFQLFQAYVICDDYANMVVYFGKWMEVFDARYDTSSCIEWLWLYRNLNRARKLIKNPSLKTDLLERINERLSLAMKIVLYYIPCEVIAKLIAKYDQEDD